jgi:hypothetical protein
MAPGITHRTIRRTTEHRTTTRPRSRHPRRLFTSKRATRSRLRPLTTTHGTTARSQKLITRTCNNVRPGGSACLRSLRRKGKSMHRRFEVCALALLLLGGCVTVPSGPSVMVLPGTGKSFDQFRADELDCRHYASSQTNMTPEEASANSGVSSAALGTLIGAAAGAAINGGTGAAVGAGVGLAGGTLAGTGAASASAYGVQQRYDFGYTQCMYSKGHRVPVSGNFAYTRAAPSQPVYSTPATPNTHAAQPPGPNSYGAPPPPPPGTPPPPPPH